MEESIHISFFHKQSKYEIDLIKDKKTGYFEINSNNLSNTDSTILKIFKPLLANNELISHSTESIQLKELIDSTIKLSGGSDCKISHSRTEYVEIKDASNEINKQMEDMWPRRMSEVAERNFNGKIICIIKNNELIGAVALEEEHDLPENVNAKKTYKLDIQIAPKFQGQGYGRKLFNFGCESAIKDGHQIYIVDMAMQGTGEELYGGEKTRDLFNVQYIFKGQRGEYLLDKKMDASTDLKYIRIDKDNSYVIWSAVESPEGMNHLIHYLNIYPEDKSLLDPSLINFCASVLKNKKYTWTESQIHNYDMNLNKMKLFF
jgi:GNAT superfamily N-acetyltransferase